MAFGLRSFLGTVSSRVRRASTLALAGLVAASSALAGGQEIASPGPEDDEAQERWERTPLSVHGSPASQELVTAAYRAGTIVELPTRSILEWTPAQVRSALLDADGGSLQRPADLVEAIMGDDRVQGVLSTRTHGLLGLPTQFFGDPEIVAALEGRKALGNHTAVPGDFARMFPSAELAKLASWGILLGVGLAERVPDERREIGERSAPRLKIWHPRWLRYQWTDDTWHLTTADGEIEIRPGDGRWILYLPYGAHRPWVYGAWRPIAFAWVLKQFALHDRARHSEVLGSAARVGIAPRSSTEDKRKRFLRDLRAMGRDNVMVLEGGPVGEAYDIKLVEATGQTWEIYGAQIEWSDRAIAITLAGQFVTTEGTKGFANGNIHNEIRLDLIQFTAESLSACLYEQGLRWWAADNYGSLDVAPHLRWDTAPPEDKQATATAYTALGTAIAGLDSALKPSGQRVNAVELCGKFGVPLLAGATSPTPTTPSTPPAQPAAEAA